MLWSRAEEVRAFEVKDLGYFLLFWSVTDNFTSNASTPRKAMTTV
jgi:hypothetical protein